MTDRKDIYVGIDGMNLNNTALGWTPAPHISPWPLLIQDMDSSLGGLVCPVCAFEMTHIDNIHYWPGHDDYTHQNRMTLGTGTEWFRGEYLDDGPEQFYGHAWPRKHVFALEINCENGHLVLITFGQHKGTTSVRTFSRDWDDADHD